MKARCICICVDKEPILLEAVGVDDNDDLRRLMFL